MRLGRQATPEAPAAPAAPAEPAHEACLRMRTGMNCNEWGVYRFSWTRACVRACVCVENTDNIRSSACAVYCSPFKTHCKRQLSGAQVTTRNTQPGKPEFGLPTHCRKHFCLIRQFESRLVRANRQTLYRGVFALVCVCGLSVQP